jgi:hypothetical protein
MNDQMIRRLWKKGKWNKCLMPWQTSSMIGLRAPLTNSKLQVHNLFVFTILANITFVDWACKFRPLGYLSGILSCFDIIFREEQLSNTLSMIEVATSRRSTWKYLQEGVMQHKEHKSLHQIFITTQRKVFQPISF